MKSEAEIVTDDEWLLRRVHKDRFRSEKVPILSPRAFEPRVKGRDPDDDGISLYREACLSSPEDVLATVAAEKRPDFGVVRLPVLAFRQMNLDIVPAPDDRIPGHVVIPALNSRDFAAAKSAYTPLLLDLATLASEDANIVVSPRLA